MAASEFGNGVRDTALLKIGRNIVNFQKIELLLKLFVLWSNVSGTPDTLKRNHKKKSKFVSKQSMGNLADNFHQTIYDDGTKSEEIVDPSGISFQFRFRLEMNEEDARRQKRQLASLVAERNRLVHKELAEVDFESEESCRNLIAKLDEQNVRVLKQLDQLKALWKAFEETRNEALAYMKTDEFLTMLKIDLHATEQRSEK